MSKKEELLAELGSLTPTGTRQRLAFGSANKLGSAQDVQKTPLARAIKNHHNWLKTLPAEEASKMNVSVHVNDIMRGSAGKLGGHLLDNSKESYSMLIPVDKYFSKAGKEQMDHFKHPSGASSYLLGHTIIGNVTMDKIKAGQEFESADGETVYHFELPTRKAPEFGLKKDFIRVNAVDKNSGMKIMNAHALHFSTADGSTAITVSRALIPTAEIVEQNEQMMKKKEMDAENFGMTDEDEY